MQPCRHGLFENVLTQPGNPSPEWCVKASLLRAPTLYDRAAQAGLSVCSVFYPVTCGAAGIRWNLPEVPGRMSLGRRAHKMFGGGSPGFILSAIPSALPILRHIGEPELDDFLLRIAVRSLRFKRPNLLLLHLIDVDYHKHRFGPGSPEALAALKRLDTRLGRLLAAACAAFGENMAVLVFSDHGCLPVHAVTEPNAWLAERGFLESGRYDAFFHNAGGTSFLRLLNKARREELTAQLGGLLKRPGVSRFLTQQEMETSGMAGEFLCGIEAAEGYAFGQEERGQHGYSLCHEGYQPFYLAAGADVPRGLTETGGCITDICPLAASLLGLEPWRMDGVNRLEALC